MTSPTNRASLIRVALQIDCPSASRRRLGVLRKLVAHTVAAERPGQRGQVSLLITEEETLRQLNQTYRGLDEGTDVLSFPLQTGDNRHPFLTPPKHTLHLGDVVISWPRALQQAEEYGHSVEDELARLAVHGVLHLLGYRDDTEEQAGVMKTKEEALLTKFWH